MNTKVEEFNFSLITEVENQRHLYDKRSPGYKDKVMKENTWKSIGKELNTTSEFCEKQWLSLRERFTRERRALKMHIPSGSAGGESKEPSAYYNALLFLEPHVRGRRNTISNIPGASENISEEITSVDEFELEMLDDDEEVLKYLKRIEENEPAATYNKSHRHQSKGSPIVHTVTDRITNKENNCFGNRTNMKRKSDEASDSAQSRPQSGSSDSSKGRSSKPTPGRTEEAALQIVTDTLQSVNGWYKSADKTDDVEWNFCMTTYSQMKRLKKPKRKLARSQITDIMINLESSGSD